MYIMIILCFMEKHFPAFTNIGLGYIYAFKPLNLPHSSYLNSLDLSDLLIFKNLVLDFVCLLPSFNHTCTNHR